MKRVLTPLLLTFLAVFGTAFAAEQGKTYTEDEIRKMNEDAKRTGPDLRKVHPPKDPIKPTERTSPTPADQQGTKP